MDKEKTLEDVLKEAKPLGWTNIGNLNNVQFPSAEENKKEDDKDD